MTLGILEIAQTLLTVKTSVTGKKRHKTNLHRDEGL